MTQRERFVEWCRAQEEAGSIYIWNADGEDVTLPDGRTVPSYDCSGFVLRGLAVIGLADRTKTYWSKRMWQEWEPVTAPRAGDCAFYGSPPDGITHVVVCLGGMDAPIIGANGGNGSTRTPAIALKQGARVKQRPSPTYRPDLRGFRRPPFTDEAP